MNDEALESFLAFVTLDSAIVEMTERQGVLVVRTESGRSYRFWRVPAAVEA